MKCLKVFIINLVKRMKIKICECCGGNYSKHGPSRYCNACANNIKAIQGENKSDGRLKEVKYKKVLKLKSGLEVLNNCFGQVMKNYDRWGSENY